MVSFWRAARATQGEMLASWSSWDMTSSEPAGNSKAKDRLRNNCVVDAPSTVSLLLQRIYQNWHLFIIPISEVEALINLAAASYPAA